jgi:hypothetical protein
MTYRPVSDPRPIPEATLADVKRALSGLEAGVYRAADLYARYAERQRTAGAEPASPSAFGRMLSDYGAIRTKKARVRAWRITPPS